MPGPDVRTNKAGWNAFRDDGRLVIVLRGDLDVAAARPWRTPILAAVEGYDGDVTLDLTQVVFLDTAGMSLLVDICERAAHKPELRVASASQPEHLLLLGHFDTLFTHGRPVRGDRAP
jgi:anti-anti-sigma factor